MTNAYKVSAAKPEGQRPLVSPKCRWENKLR